jgi:Ca2+-binding RTX toxin-like protein
LSDAQLNATFASYSSLGVAQIRTDLWWNVVQARGPGTFDWRVFDRVLDTAQSHGIDILPVLGRAPSWATTSGNVKDFAAFAAAAAARYGSDGIVAWEIWNEPNLTSFWGGTPDPAVYARLLTAAYDAIKAVDPGATVLSGGLAAVPTTDTGPAPRWMAATEFLEGVYAAGRDAEFFDAVAFHPYTWPFMPSHSASWSGWTIMTSSLRAIMTAHGDGDATIWVTEYGAPTAGSTRAVSEQVQAIILVEAAGLAASDDRIGPVFCYSLYDKGHDLESAQSWFGLIRPDGVRKIGYDLLKDALQYGAPLVPGLTVESSTSRVLGLAEGKLALIGTAAVDGTGNAAANIIVGNGAANTLDGNAGNDILHGAGGGDRLLGDEGADRLYGAAGPDQVFGGTGADVLVGQAGTDRLEGGDDDDRLAGGGDNDALYGGYGKDMLSGGAGADRLEGGLGNDTYVVDSLDLILEAAGAGTDTVRVGFSYALVAGSNLENLVLLGTASLNGTGNELANGLVGNSGVNALSGLLGSDWLNGRGGKDVLTGGGGNDAFLFTAKAESGDFLTDFSHVSGNNDHLRISAAGFGGGLTAGSFLSATQFQSRADNLAQDLNDRFIFRSPDQTLWFDSNGNQAGGLTLVAELQTGAVVTAGDILLI